MIIEISQRTPDLHLSTLLHKRTGNSAHLDEKAPWNRLIVLLNLAACGWFLAIILAPKYESSQYVVPDTWHGSSPFAEAKPADGELRPD
jgi:hypothetical protein